MKYLPYRFIILTFALFIAFANVVNSQTVIFSDDFETDKGWTLTGEFERGAPAGIGGDYGNPDPTSAVSGSNVLGVDLTGQNAYPGDYENNLTDREYTATSPSFNCSNYDIVTLEFQRWLNVEQDDYDNAYIEVSNDGSTWNVVWENDNTTITDAAWNLNSVDISAYAAGYSSVQVRFSMGATDWGWTFSGWNIDDLEVIGIEGPEYYGDNPGLVYWLRGDLGVTGTTPVTNWADQSGNGNDATDDPTGPDQLISADLNNQEVMSFNGTTALTIANDARINASTANERTMFVAFRTGADVSSATPQYIYEQGGGTRGIGIYIKSDNVYVITYASSGTDRMYVYESVSVNTSYILSFAWNSGTLTAKLNNVPFTNQGSSGVAPVLTSHTGDITIGRAGGPTRDEDGTSVNGQNFTGQIAELIYYDAALIEADEVEINNYLGDRYGVDVSVDFDIYYSYQTGNWNQASTWTHDPGGTTQTATDFPNSGDKVVILNNRTVSLTEDVDTTMLDVTVRDGGILDQSTFEFTAGLSALRGDGTFKLATVNYPTVSTNDFVNSDGGTTEYNNAADFTLPAVQSTYYHLRINAPGVVATQLSDITLNGDLHVKQGTYRINDNTAARRKLTIQGDVLVDNGSSITIGPGNTDGGDISGATTAAPFIDYYDLNSHRIVVYGDFTNNGTVKFTNQSYPEYDAFPTNGMATVYFMGASNNTLECNGTTDFYNLVLDKGIDQTYKLTVYSSAYSNFRLFGRNDLGGENGGDNPDLRKALWIRTGTLELTGLSVIPSLTEANSGGSPNGDFYIPVNAGLLLNGTEVIVLSTADDYREVNLAYGVSATSNGDLGIRASGGTQSFSIYGKLQVDKGYFSTRESGGIITWDVSSGELIINGGIVDAKQYRSAGTSGGLASFNQSGGSFILRGRFQRTPSAYSTISNLKDFSTTTLNTTRVIGGLEGTLGTFNINESANVFSMSGGTIQIYDVCGTAENEAFEVYSADANNSVTGGTLELIPTTGSDTDATEFIIKTTADLGNLTINRASSSATVDINTYDLTILEDLTITSGELDANSLDISIGGDFIVENGAVYTPGTNWTAFNGSGAQSFEINTATALSINKFKVDKPASTVLTIAGTQGTLNVADSMMIINGTLADGGKDINLAGTIATSSYLYNSGTHTGAGKIVMNDNVPQIITGNGNGIFENIELNNTDGSAAPVSLEANTTINGTLTFSQDNLFDISTNNLTFGEDATVVNAGTNRFIQCAGNSGDGGVTRVYTASSPSFTFPVGAPSTEHAAAEYTPATIGFSAALSSYGTVTIIPVGYEHPVLSTGGNNLSYYWRVKSDGITGYAGNVTHSFTYSESDVKGTDGNYVPAVYDPLTYTWYYGQTADFDDANNEFGEWTTPSASADFLNGEYTGGVSTAFVSPTTYYSYQSGVWSDAATWSLTDHTTNNPPSNAPKAGDVVIIGGQDSIYLSVEPALPVGNGDPGPNFYREDEADVACASIKIEVGSVLDIQNNPGCDFGTVVSHENGNGKIRLTTRANSFDAQKTFVFPAGDFSDFNKNMGTTELYTINPQAGTVFWLPNGIMEYGNLIISPYGGSNIVFPNNDVLIYGDLTTNGQNSESWFCPNWRTSNYLTAPTVPVSKTITVLGDFDIKGGALVWYNRNNTGAQDFVIHGDLIVGTDAGIQVYTNGFGNTQQITIGGSLINNSLAPGADPDGYRGADFTNIPLIFNGSSTEYITNDDPSDNTYTIIESLTVNIGSSSSDSLVVDITGTFDTPTDDWLTLTNGTFKYLHDNDLTITEGSQFTIPSTAGLYINTPGNTVYLANDNVDNNDVYLYGKLTIIDGDVYIGQTAAPNNNNDIEYSGGGNSEIDIQGGSLTVNGQVRRNPSTSAGILKYKQSGGAVTINGRNALADNAKLEILNAGSVFNMSAGTLTIVRGGGNGTFGDLYIRPASSSITGGEIMFNPGAAGAQNFIFDANVPVWDLTIEADADVELLVSDLQVNGDLTLTTATSTLDANVNFDIPVTINGNFDNSGVYEHRNNLTTFNGGTQQILGTASIDFYDLTVNSLTKLTLNGDANVDNDLTLSRGTLECDVNTVYVQGNVTNNANYTDSNAGLVLNGSSQQYIYGTGTWGQLELDNKEGARVEDDITLQKDLILTKGILDINDQLLTLQATCDILGAPFDETKMITSDGVYSNVGLRKYFDLYSGANQTFLFPLGTSGKYTPAELTYSDIGNVGYIRINNINDNHPGVIDQNNVLDYYWEIESGGITGFNGSLVLNYLEEDVQLTGANTEADYIAAALLIPGTSWIKSIDDVDEAANTITFNYSAASNLDGEYTCGVDAALPNQVPEFTSINNGDWSDDTNWNQTGGDAFELTGGPNGFIVIIEADDTITTDVNYATAYRMTIDGKIKVNSATYGHNLGTVSGTGTLYLESGTFPAGRFTDFLDCSNNATLEYGGNTNYSLIADLYSSIPNLHFSGTGTRTLPNKDLTICNQLLIDGPTLDNTISNRKLTILGTMERYNTGAFNSGTGANAIVSFAGSAAQTIGGVLGDFTGTNAFNNFEIDNSAGLTINTNGTIEISGDLLLTNGNIITTSTNTLSITNTDINCVLPAGGSSNSYIDGPLTKKINQGDDFVFPIGKGVDLGNKVELSSTQSSTIDWTVEFFTPNSSYTNKAAPLTYVNSHEYWTVSAPSGSQAYVGIDWDAASDLTPLMTQNGVSDMRVAYDNAGTWTEITSTGSGTASNGTVTTTNRVSIPAGGSTDFTTACINVTKPRARLNPSGDVCGTAGIPVTFTGSALAYDYILTYEKGGVLQAPVTITSADVPYTLPTDAIGTTYQLISFTYDEPGNSTTGVVDPSVITTYTVPTTADIGSDGGLDDDDQSICGGTSAVLEGNVPGVGTGQWSVVSGTGGSFVDPTDPTTTFNGTNGTTYTLRWTISNGGCTSDDEVVIAFPLLPVQPGAFTVSSAIVCQGDQNVEYTVPNDPSVTYTWDYSGTGYTITGSGNSVELDFATNATSGTVSVFATNGCGDSAPREVDVTVNTLPVFTPTATPASICFGDASQLDANFDDGSTTYLWSPAGELDNSGIKNPEYTPATNPTSPVQVTTTFSVTVTDSNACSDVETVDVVLTRTPETGEQYHISNDANK